MDILKKILENSRYIVLLAVISTLFLSLSMFLLNTFITGKTIFHMFSHLGTVKAGAETAHMIAILDSFLLAVILYIFSIALYELFIGKLDLPKWLAIKDLDDLKKKLSSVIALMLGVVFLEHVVDWKDSKSTMEFAIAIALIICALVLYMWAKPSGDKK